MSKILTAKEFLKEENLNKLFESKPNNHLETILIEFAKMHCKAQTKAICENVIVGSWAEDYEIDKDSILTAYPEINIL